MPEPTFRSSPTRIALKIAGLYFVLGGLWIQFSDMAVEILVSDAEMLSLVYTFKGWGFVLVTAILLWFLTVRLLREASRMREETESTRHWLEQVGGYMDDVVWVMDANFRYRYVSPSVRHQRGLTPEEVMVQGIRGSVDEPTYELLLERMKSGLAEVRERHAKGETDIVRGRLDIDVLDRGGRRVPVEVRFTVLGDGTGGVSGICGVTRNVAERRQAEAALQRETERAQRYLSLAPVVFVGLDADFRTTLVNQKACDLLEYTKEEILGESFIDRFMPETEHAEAVQRANDLLSSNSESVTYHENHVVTRSGEMRLIAWNLTILRDSQGSLTGILAAGEDITERTEAQNALRENEFAMRSLLNAIPEITFLMHTDGTIVAANRAAGEYVHMPATDLVGRSAFDMIPPGMTEVMAYRRDQVDLAVRSQTRVRFQDADSTGIWDHCVSPVFDSEGRVTMVAVLARDVTHYLESLRAREKAEKDLAKHRSLAARADRLRSLGEMATGIAHELNQPLVGVRGLAEHMLIALERQWELRSEEMKENLELIVEQADRMHHIIEHVRMFSREAGQGNPSPVSVNEVVLSSLEMVGRQFESRGVVVDQELMEGLPRILANPYSLEEVLLNLLSNARYSVQERMTRGETPRIPHITLRTRQGRRGSVLIEVRDKGMGIDPDLHERIFDPFFTTKDSEHGTGLGLSICRAIIEEMNGMIDLDSTVGQGTTMRIELPAVGSVHGYGKRNDTDSPEVAGC